MQPISLADALAGGTVNVVLLADRDFKEDCQAGTGIVWNGKGDVQPYPAKLWHKLAQHPTVWGLAEEQPASAPKVESETAEAKRLRLSTAESERVRKVAEEKAQDDADKQRQAELQLAAEAKARADEAAGQGTDLVTLIPEGNLDADAADAYDYAALTQDVQDAMTVEQLHELAFTLDYGLNPRLGEKKLRPAFAEITAQRLAQLEEEVDTTGVDDASGPA